jgi:hypothetical protein
MMVSRVTAVFVVVTEVGVEVAREPVLGVAGQQSQDHLKAAAPGAQQRGSRVRVDVAGGQFRGDRLACRHGGGEGQMPKLTVRVRFPSPAPREKAQVRALYRTWAWIVPVAFPIFRAIKPEGQS